MARASANFLRDVGRLLTRSHDLAETLDNVARLVARWMHASACSIYVLEEDGETLVLRATRGLNPKAVDRVRIRLGQGIAGRALEQRETIAVPDVRLDTRVQTVSFSGEQRFRSLVVPLLVRGGRGRGRRCARAGLSSEQLELLEMIADSRLDRANARLLDHALHAAAGALRAARARAARARLGAARIGNSPGVARGKVHLMAAAGPGCHRTSRRRPRGGVARCSARCARPSQPSPARARRRALRRGSPTSSPHHDSRGQLPAEAPRA
jgi:phosphotransferase system enzyme I (PtsP)